MMEFRVKKRKKKQEGRTPRPNNEQERPTLPVASHTPSTLRLVDM